MKRNVLDRNMLDYLHQVVESEQERMEEEGRNISEDGYLVLDPDYNEEEYSYDDEDYNVIDEDYDSDGDYDYYDDGDYTECIEIPEPEEEENLQTIYEDYIPHESEMDLFPNFKFDREDETQVTEEEVEEEIESLVGKEETIYDVVDNATSDINIPLENIDDTYQELSRGDSKEKRIATNIAKEAIVREQEKTVLLPGDESDGEDDSWVEEDLFGNDINGIIAPAPSEDNVIDIDYEAGSFDDWVKDVK